MGKQKINGDLVVTGKLNPNDSGYGFITPDNSSLVEDKTIATTDQVALKADKVGPLPYYYIENPTSFVLPFLQNNNLVGKLFIFALGPGTPTVFYIASFKGHTTPYPTGKYDFEVECTINSLRYYGENIDLTTVSFYDIVVTNSIYRQDYEISNNKVTSLAASSTDTQYPSAKCVWELTRNPFTIDVNETIATIKTACQADSAKKFYCRDTTTSEIVDKTSELLAGDYDNTVLENNRFASNSILSIEFNSGQHPTAIKKDKNYYLIGRGDGITIQISKLFGVRDILMASPYYVDRYYSGGNNFTVKTAHDPAALTKTNIATSISSTSTNDKAAGAKLVYDQLALKADKVGPLPEFLVNTTDNVLEFIENNGVNGKPLILHLNIDVTGRAYYYQGILINTSSRLSFMFEEVSTGYVYKGQIPGNTSSSTTFADIISSLYLRMYEDLGNKVTSLSSSSTDTQYPSAKCVYDECQNIREVAEGKCKTYIVRHSQRQPESYLWSTYHYYDFTDNTIKSFESQQHLTDWLNSLTYNTCLNSSFNSNNDTLELSLRGYLVFWSLDNQSQVIVYLPSTLYGDQEKFFRKGDIFIVFETEVPDRWYGSIYYHDSYLAFNKLETSKVPLENYYTKTEINAWFTPVTVDED